MGVLQPPWRQPLLLGRGVAVPNNVLPHSIPFWGALRHCALPCRTWGRRRSWCGCLHPLLLSQLLLPARQLLYQMRYGTLRYVGLQGGSRHLPHATEAYRSHRPPQQQLQPASCKLFVTLIKLVFPRSLVVALPPFALPGALRFILRSSRLRLPRRCRLGLVGGLLHSHTFSEHQHAPNCMQRACAPSARAS